MDLLKNILILICWCKVCTRNYKFCVNTGKVLDNMSNFYDVVFQGAIWGHLFLPTNFPPTKDLSNSYLYLIHEKSVTFIS
jgi:hypothetical protein